MASNVVRRHRQVERTDRGRQEKGTLPPRRTPNTGAEVRSGLRRVPEAARLDPGAEEEQGAGHPRDQVQRPQPHQGRPEGDKEVQGPER